ncbi:MAG: NYN domain-containing protein [Pseudomonadota bacterium]|nr:NYN domain-containing protein [Pseudomonadota bacterium]
MRLAIDGYNLIAAIAGSPLDFLDLEVERESLIGMLADYRSCRRHVVEVVFDGWQVAAAGARKSHEQGVKIIFSPLGMKADLVLLRLAEKYGSGLTVVTDDGDLRHKVQRYNAVTIGALEFYDQMMVAVIAGEKGLTGEDDDLAERRQDRSTKKKGNPRRLSRKERQKAKRIKSL